MPWSDWQDPWVAPYIVEPARFDYQVFTADDTGNGSAVVDALIDDIRAGTGAAGDFADGFGFQSQGPDATGAHARIGYDAATFLGSGLGLPIGLPPDFPDDGFGDIPDGEVDDNTRYGLVQYEDGTSSFDSWEDLTYGDIKNHLTAYDSYTTPRFTPPATTDFVVATVATPFSGGTQVSNDSGIPVYWGGFVAYDDLVDTVADFALPAEGEGAAAPLTVDSSGDWVGGQDVTMTLSDLVDEDITLVVMSKYMGPLDMFFIPESPSGFNSFWFYSSRPGSLRFDGLVAIAFFSTERGFAQRPFPVMNRTTPRWRYWIPEAGWHTIGGHVGSLGTGRRFIKTGGVMQPVLDGLAT